MTSGPQATPSPHGPCKSLQEGPHRNLHCPPEAAIVEVGSKVPFWGDLKYSKIRVMVAQL